MFRGDSGEAAQRAAESRAAAFARNANPLAGDFHFPALAGSATSQGGLSRGSWGPHGAGGPRGGEKWPALGPSGSAGASASASASRPALSGWGSRGSLSDEPRGTSAFPTLIASSSSASLSGAAPPRPASLLAASEQPQPPTTTAAAAAAGSEEDDSALARRRQLADAFGVADPEHRPSMFAASSAATFSADVVKVARQNPEFVRLLEAALEHAINSRKMRVSLQPMPRSQRAVVHELSKAYGITTQSYGNEPQRRVDLFVLPTAAVPSIRLARARTAPGICCQPCRSKLSIVSFPLVL